MRDRAELGAIFTDLCERVAADLKRKGYVGKTIGIKLRYDDFQTATRDHTVDTGTDDAATIRKVAGQCLKRVPLDRKLRLLGVRVGKLAKAGESPAPAAAPRVEEARADRIDPMGSMRSSLTVGPATSVAHHWFPASIRDSLAMAAPVVPQSSVMGTPLPPLAQAQAQPQAPAAPVGYVPATVIPTAPDTRVMGARTAPPPQPLWLEVLTPGTNASVDIGEVVVRGRTLPGAEVRVQVDAVPQAPPGRTVVAQPVMLQTVRADAQGEFSFTIGPQRAPPGMRYDVLLRASDGTRSTPDQRLVLIHRG